MHDAPVAQGDVGPSLRAALTLDRMEDADVAVEPFRDDRADVLAERLAVVAHQPLAGQRDEQLQPERYGGQDDVRPPDSRRTAGMVAVPILPASQLTQGLTGASFEGDPAGAYFPTAAFST